MLGTARQRIRRRRAVKLIWNAIAIFGPADRRAKPHKARESRATTAAPPKRSSS
jgi:hypothetical protein